MNSLEAFVLLFKSFSHFFFSSTVYFFFSLASFSILTVSFVIFCLLRFFFGTLSPSCVWYYGFMANFELILYQYIATKINTFLRTNKSDSINPFHWIILFILYNISVVRINVKRISQSVSSVEFGSSVPAKCRQKEYCSQVLCQRAFHF